MKKYLPIGIIVAIIAIGGGLLLANNNKKTDNSSDTSNNTSNTATQSNKTSSTSPATNASTNPSASSTDKVSIENFAFSPAKITVKMGTKVTWTNNDSVAHTVTADSGTGPKSDSMSPGASYSYTFDSAGTFAYHCAIHPDMTGTVTVTQ